jgi:hypothetical protein
MTVPTIRQLGLAPILGFIDLGGQLLNGYLFVVMPATATEIHSTSLSSSPPNRPVCVLCEPAPQRGCHSAFYRMALDTASAPLHLGTRVLFRHA